MCKNLSLNYLRLYIRVKNFTCFHSLTPNIYSWSWSLQNGIDSDSVCRIEFIIPVPTSRRLNVVVRFPPLSREMGQNSVPHPSLSGAPSSAPLLSFLTSGPDLGRGPTVGSPWSFSTPPSLGRCRVAPPPPGI